MIHDYTWDTYSTVHPQSFLSFENEFALISHLLDDLDLVIIVLNGLGHSFCEFTVFIRTRDTPLLFDELFDKLIHFEISCNVTNANNKRSLPLLIILVALAVRNSPILLVIPIQMALTMQHRTATTFLLVIMVRVPDGLYPCVNIVINEATQPKHAINYMDF
ncbi:hypothetical protein VNO78_20470 [Psophocarpus tetragonolobus]|uniref:Uncharacterized protein n=1 Tax=Psophocarpus tetragonolobus TaxID=3891 RepID=A0AAN9S9G7_PSOTE